MALPDFIKPMLAKPGAAFDSNEHLFEIKWDGIRAVAYIEQGRYRLLSRRGLEVSSRYPELAFLAQLPSGTVLDGELVVLNDQGLPEFHAVLRREQARTALRQKTLAQRRPANYIVFDQLYHDGHSLMEQPLTARRTQLMQTVGGCSSEQLVASDGVVGPGKDFFAQVVSRELEGVVAKRLNSRYFPGRRTDAWIKVRKSSSLLCAIIGYMPKGDDFESLILAANDEGELRCVGRVGTGFNTPLRKELNQLLREHQCSAPLIPCDFKGVWVQSGLYCSVRYLEMTRRGELREPVFEQLIHN